MEHVQRKIDREVNKTFIENYRPGMSWTEMNTLIRQVQEFRITVVQEMEKRGEFKSLRDFARVDNEA